MSVQNIQAEQLPFLYISGMNLSVASTTIMAIAPGQCRDQNDNIDMEYPAALYLNSAVIGAGGLDFGVLLASTNYLVWAIADSSGKLPNSGLISLQANVAPLLPYGYDSMRLIGAVTTDSSVHFDAATVLNANYYKGFFIKPPVSVLSGGNATSFTAIDLSSAIPTTSDPFVIALATCTFIPLAAGDVATFRPTGYTGTTANLPVITGRVAGVAQTDNIVLNCGVGSTKPEVDYEVSVSGDALSMSIYGYYVTLS
jgi:hypothetical protein